ncbi:uncharacterized protein LOC109814805 [Cajanus cajan]|uniref:uncharacterized protein LOC109814805 n=1 Tax=Cajanus cajan TaxID=3821 RepID=UPI00098D9A4F|nr:uncharacterized protein LOC109814805 [Cajanus cajan]
MIEKLALALVTAARRLRPYFQSHQVVVKTGYPIKQILRKPELAGRMIAWSVELSEFGIQYESRGPLKAQCLANFIAKLTPTTAEEPQVWTLHVDGFGIPHALVTDNGRQFIAQDFEDFLRELGIKHLATSVEHPQTNGQAEAANKIILRELKKRLGTAKGQWPEELPSILWAYHCTPQSTTQETPYWLTYGADAMILVEVGEASHRRQVFNDE